jgi:hypothetical protein
VPIIGVPINLGNARKPFALPASAPSPVIFRDRQFLPKDAGELIDPEVSWLSYQCVLVINEDDRIAVNVPLAGVVQTGAGGGQDALGDVARLRNNVAHPGPTVRSSVANIIQRVSGPVHTVRLVGEAMRLAYEIAPPVLLSFAGQAVVQKNRRLTPASTGTLGGFRIYYLAWDTEYVLAGAPATIPLPATILGQMSGHNPAT